MTRSLLALCTLLLAAAPASAQRLFRESAPLEVTLVTDLRSLIRQRDSTKLVAHPATLTYRNGTDAAVSFPVTLRARGHFRRQARNCAFPPLKLEFKAADARPTIFRGNTAMKITTNCRPGNTDYEQYVLGEYALYRAYAAVSPRHFRTRLARITYRDVANASPEVVSWAFFVEDDSEVAKEYNLRVMGTHGALFADLDVEQLAITSLYQYMVANTDWSISGLHNISILRDSVGRMYPVAYDFDWSGAVNPRYAFPNEKLRIRSVTDRLFRGPCKAAAEWQPAFDRFIAARPRITAILDSVPAIEPRRKQTMSEFFEEFYRTLANPRDVRGAIVTECQQLGN